MDIKILETVVDEITSEIIEELEKKYKKIATLQLIKTGKLKKRKGIMRSIFYLLGLGPNYIGVSLSGSGNAGYQRVARCNLKFSKNSFFEGEFLIDNYIISSLKKIFGDCVVDISTYDAVFDSYHYQKAITVQYKTNNNAWLIIDYLLNKYHSDNIIVQDNITYIVDLHRDTQQTEVFDFLKKQSLNTKELNDAKKILLNNGYTFSKNTLTT